MAGTIVGNQQTPTLYHYQAGSWTSASLPTGVNIDRLRMVSPNDIWASRTYQRAIELGFRPNSGGTAL